MVTSDERTVVLGVGSITRYGADFYARLFGKSCYKNRLACRKGVNKTRAIGFVHGDIVPWVDQENGGLDDVLKA